MIMNTLNKKPFATEQNLISDEFFNSLLSFYNSLKIGDRELVLNHSADIKKHIEQSFSSDVFRLAYINIVNCFSIYLDDKQVLSYLELVPDSVEHGFEIITILINAWFEKVCAKAGASEYLKREVIRIVEEEFSNPLLSVTMLADRLGISTSYLSRYFKEKFGVTLFSYIDEIRISRAKQLLFETDLNVKEIVKAVGYNDVNNFNRKFKVKTGKTPSVYRKEV